MASRWCRLYRGTPAELAMEDAVAALGVPYRNNFPGFMYGTRSFPDLYLPTLALVIEVDDPSHNKADKIIADAERTEALELAWGVRVVRCTNDEALEDARGTLKRLLSSVGLWPLPSRLPSLRQSLPQSRKAPQAVRRASRSAATKARRRGSSVRRPAGPATRTRRAGRSRRPQSPSLTHPPTPTPSA